MKKKEKAKEDVIETPVEVSEVEVLSATCPNCEGHGKFLTVNPRIDIICPVCKGTGLRN